mmetsp:Transcript_33047/g.60995  ORF Transcript_33047/g.60995 Transcript_33047/m.60995 type:complete len:951 (+) Transcript_33047:207-3059(+)
MAGLRCWSLLLSFQWLLPAETDESFICTFVRVRVADATQADAMVQAMLDTWGRGARLVSGDVAGTRPLLQHLSQHATLLQCPWLLLIPAANVYVNLPVLASMLQHLSASHFQAFSLPHRGPLQRSHTPQVVSLTLIRMCADQHQTSAPAACQNLEQPRPLHELAKSDVLTNLVDIRGYHSFSLRHVDTCLLAVLNVQGWVHAHHIDAAVRRSGGMAKCKDVFQSLALQGQTWEDPEDTAFDRAYYDAKRQQERNRIIQEQKIGLRPESDLEQFDRRASELRSNSAAAADALLVGQESGVGGEQAAGTLELQGPLCIFVNTALPQDADKAQVDLLVDMVQVAQESWATNSTVFVLPPVSEEPPGLTARLSGVKVSHLPEIESKSATLQMFASLRFWKHVLPLAERASSCAWAMKVPLWTYVNSAALARRLSCFNESKAWMLGVMTAAYSPGLDPFMFPGNIAGTILSRGSYDHVGVWSDFCLNQWSPLFDAASSPDFIEDYSFSLCLSDLGNMHGTNYADDKNFIIVERASRTMELFVEVPDAVKQCLFIVGTLGGPHDVRYVHEWITWSEWHEGVPCIGETSFTTYSMGDALGNKKPYFHEEIRLAIYYCKDTRMLELEQELSAKLAHKNPRDGRGALDKGDNQAAAAARRHLCIFVPSSARKERFIHAAEVAWKNWGSVDTFFVAPTRLSPLLDPQTVIFDLDIDTDYARLPVRTFRLFEALGKPEWVSACDWYMKADADSFVNVPLIANRLRCFDPGQYWFLGVPQIAHGQQGSTTRFASGGAGYVISRALLPRVATWAPFCLLQQLQHSGGAGMEDVSLAGCIHKWGGISVASYVDPQTEVITSEAALNRTCVFCQPEEGAVISVPPCTFVVHSLTPEQVPIARKNIEQAQKESVIDLQCRPDAERVRHYGDILVAPLEGMGFAEDAMWSVYAEPELEALLRCSGSA